MTETIDRAALIAQAKRMSLYVQRGGPDDGTVYDRLAVALAESEREVARLLGLIAAAIIVAKQGRDNQARYGPNDYNAGMQDQADKITDILAKASDIEV